METTITSTELASLIINIFNEEIYSDIGYYTSIDTPYSYITGKEEFEKKIKHLLSDFEVTVKHPTTDLLEGTNIKISELLDNGFTKYGDGTYGKGDINVEVNIAPGGITCIQNVKWLTTLITFLNPVTTFEELQTICKISLPK